MKNFISTTKQKTTYVELGTYSHMYKKQHYEKLGTQYVQKTIL